MYADESRVAKNSSPNLIAGIRLKAVKANDKCVIKAGKNRIAQ